MATQIDKYKILATYFPQDYGWWIDLNWDDKDPTEPEKTIKEEFDKWLSWATKEDTYVDALDRLKNIQGERSEREFEELVWHVHAVSFFAAPLNSKIKLNIKETLQDKRDNLQNIQSQVLAIERLRGLIKERQGTPYDPLSLFVKREELFDINNLPKKGLEFYWPYPDREWLSFPFELFDKALEIYLKRLKADLEEDPSDDYLEDLMLAKKWGALIYSSNLTPQAQRSCPEINSLLFNLVFLFRQFTSEQPDESWLRITRGLMPEFGSPSYNHVADISNSILTAAQILKGDEDGFDNTMVMDRVRNLTTQGVQLGSWGGIGL
jgi:hypothetical protein